MVSYRLEDSAQPKSSFGRAAVLERYGVKDGIVRGENLGVCSWARYVLMSTPYET